MTLREVVHAHIPLIGPTSTFRDAVDKMDIYQFSALMVVDEDQRLLGVLTEGDLCRAVTVNENLTSLSNMPVTNFATKLPTSMHADTEVSDALHKMLMSGLTVLPVIDTDRVIGMVLRIDLMQALLIDCANADGNIS